MFKKYVETRIKDGIYSEFGFMVKITKINYYSLDGKGDNLFFGFESIFEDCEVLGYLDSDCNCQFAEDAAYNTIRNYYRGY